MTDFCVTIQGQQGETLQHAWITRNTFIEYSNQTSVQSVPFTDIDEETLKAMYCGTGIDLLFKTLKTFKAATSTLNILLTGSSGTGKTALLRSLCGLHGLKAS